ncbi:hypothetical protein DICVIV_02424 [Dictyocaulus viviparus]|uniref:Uncharacterized protein n=1 Tax=Dictyocaulus viviparus TaxID=29172 RepID=A0A0D8Y3W6_DICVI|nr:hypothetical protein DICVIV_02424 [Dictyocaulus viviparus]
MSYVFHLNVILLLFIVYLNSEANFIRQSSAVGAHFSSSGNMSPKEVRREHRERRILRRKKQRMRELREEIRNLTSSLQHMHMSTMERKPETEHKQKNRHGRKGLKWRKNLLEKLKTIVKRLDRMEKRIVERMQDIFTDSPPTNRTEMSLLSTSFAYDTLTTEITNEKMKRIQPAISRSRSGENGAICSSHNDCRPGHCCHRVINNNNDIKSFCVLYRLSEKAECVDGCQCSSHLSCFIPDRLSDLNVTNAYCKKATSSDILNGSYLYKKDSVITVIE